MINKIISIVIFFLLAFYIPLLGNLKLIFSLQIGLLFLTSIVLFMTMPALSVKETSQEKSTDGYSIIGIMAACLMSQTFSIMEWAYCNESHNFEFDTATMLGLILIISGTSFRVASIRTLGKYFTGTVKTQPNQKIITAGPYRIIRHPSYTGTYIALLGSSIFLQAYFGIVVSTILIFAAYHYRIKVEEETLVKVFGDEYRTYQLKTKKMVPYVY